MLRHRKRATAASPVGRALNRPKRRVSRWIGRALVVLIAGTGAVAQPLLAPASEARATADAPQVYTVLGATKRMVPATASLRADIVLKLPHGLVDATSGELRSLGGAYLRVGFDASGESGTPAEAPTSLNYLNTLGAKQVDNWPRNKEDKYTIHKVMPGGVSDYVVMSLAAAMRPASIPANNVPGGRATRGKLYFSLEQSSDANPSAQSKWFNTAMSTHELEYRMYSDTPGPENVSGPIAQIQRQGEYNLWSGAQASWGQMLDSGMSGHIPGFMPRNALAADIMNLAWNSEAEGPSGSVSTGFWYAWVQEDGTLVKSINTAPIKVSGGEARGNAGGWFGKESQIAKNVTPKGSQPTLSYTKEAGAQGLTYQVGFEGAVSFRTAKGTGYYRLLVWPEASDPSRVSVDNGAKSLSYTPEDLFVGGRATARALDEAFTIGSTFYKYEIGPPPPPVITQPADGGEIGGAAEIRIKGRGEPGHSITLRGMPGAKVTDLNDPKLETIVDGDRLCDPVACTVVVGADGNWEFVYRPKTPLAEGPYTFIAMQTRQDAGTPVTSTPSNPGWDGSVATWGTSVQVDSTVPKPPIFPCPTETVTDKRPTFTGSGMEEGARGEFFIEDRRMGSLDVSGGNWSYTFTEDLDPGSYRMGVKQADRAGNWSEVGFAGCRIEVSDDVLITGYSGVLPMSAPIEGIPTASSGDWEVIITDGEIEQVISGKTPGRLKRGVTYSLVGRVPAGTDDAQRAVLRGYNKYGPPSCEDGEGKGLTYPLFDSNPETLHIGVSDTVTGPVTCGIPYVTSHVSYVVKQLGGKTEAASPGWTLVANPTGMSISPIVPIKPPRPAPTPSVESRKRSEAGLPFEVDGAASAGNARPAGYTFGGRGPEGLSVVAIEIFERNAEECRIEAPDLTQVPESCWRRVRGNQMMLTTGGQANFRLIAGDAGDFPVLPFTGGAGSWLFTLAGICALGIAAVACGYQLWRRRAAFSPSTAFASPTRWVTGENRGKN